MGRPWFGWASFKEAHSIHCDELKGAHVTTNSGSRDPAVQGCFLYESGPEGMPVQSTQPGRTVDGFWDASKRSYSGQGSGNAPLPTVSPSVKRKPDLPTTSDRKMPRYEGDPRVETCTGLSDQTSLPDEEPQDVPTSAVQSGTAYEYVRTLPPMVLIQGGQINGHAVDPLTFLMHSLAERFGTLGEEMRLTSITDLFHFKRNVAANERIDEVITRFDMLRQRAFDMGQLTISVTGLTWLLLRACEVSDTQLLQLLGPFQGRFPQDEAEFSALKVQLRRMGHILERSPGNIAASLRGPGGLHPNSTRTYLAEAGAGTQPPQPSAESWGEGWSQSAVPTWHASDSYSQPHAEPVWYAEDSDNGTDTDTASSSGETVVPQATPEGDTDPSSLTEYLFWAYTRAKAAWRKHLNKPTRAVRRHTRRYIYSRSKGLKGFKGKGYKGRPNVSTFLAELGDDEVEYVFKGMRKGKGKGKAHRSTGKGKGRKSNPKGRDGQTLRCFRCGSEAHLSRECHLPRTDAHASRTQPQPPNTFYAYTPSSAVPDEGPLSGLIFMASPAEDGMPGATETDSSWSYPSQPSANVAPDPWATYLRQQGVPYAFLGHDTRMTRMIVETPAPTLPAWVQLPEFGPMATLIDNFVNAGQAVTQRWRIIQLPEAADTQQYEAVDDTCSYTGGALWLELEPDQDVPSAQVVRKRMPNGQLIPGERISISAYTSRSLDQADANLKQSMRPDAQCCRHCRRTTVDTRARLRGIQDICVYSGGAHDLAYWAVRRHYSSGEYLDLLAQAAALTGRIALAQHESGRYFACEQAREEPTADLQAQLPEGQGDLAAGEEDEAELPSSASHTSPDGVNLPDIDKELDLPQLSAAEKAAAAAADSREELFEALQTAWIGIHGPMECLVSDGESGLWKEEIAGRLKRQGVTLKPRAPQQHARFIERRGAVLRVTMHVMQEQLDREGLVYTFPSLLAEAIFAGNALTHVGGSTPYQAVYGRQPAMLPALDAPDHQDHESISAAGDRQRASIRHAALQAMIQATSLLARGAKHLSAVPAASPEYPRAFVVQALHTTDQDVTLADVCDEAAAVTHETLDGDMQPESDHERLSIHTPQGPLSAITEETVEEPEERPDAELSAFLASCPDCPEAVQDALTQIFQLSQSEQLEEAEALKQDHACYYNLDVANPATYGELENWDEVKPNEKYTSRCLTGGSIIYASYQIAGEASEVDALIKYLESGFGKLTYQEGTFTNCGLQHIRMPDGSVQMNQHEYIKAMRPIHHPELTGRRSDEPCTAEVHSLFQSLLGAVAYCLLSQSWAAVFVVALQRRTTNPLNLHVRRLNLLLAALQKQKCSLVFPSMTCKQHVLVYSDASFDKETENKGYGMRGTVFLRMGARNGQPCCHLLEAQSQSLKLVTRSTFASETLAAVGAIDNLTPLLLTFEEFTKGALSPARARQLREFGGFTFSSELCIDAMNLFYALTAVYPRLPAEKTLFVHISWLRDMFQRGVPRTVSWSDTRDMVADGLTKGKVDRTAILEAMRGVLHVRHPKKSHEGSKAASLPGPGS
ncbi:unnamed protein product [Symbiodinium sp. KB8]|nr:unnamed protein product [Symbiodinium sp. KB8]